MEGGCWDGASDAGSGGGGGFRIGAGIQECGSSSDGTSGGESGVGALASVADLVQHAKELLVSLEGAVNSGCTPSGGGGGSRRADSGSYCSGAVTGPRRA